jgi:hypothetical protein
MIGSRAAHALVFIDTNINMAISQINHSAIIFYGSSICYLRVGRVGQFYA